MTYEYLILCFMGSERDYHPICTHFYTIGGDTKEIYSEHFWLI